jgi:hypothetical protein
MIFVRDHMNEFKKTGDRNLLYLEAAGGVICQYLNKFVFDEVGIDPFLAATKVNDAADIWYGFPLRIILIGETLFLLRSSKSFSEICRRLKIRDLRSAYYEMLAAKTFYKNGFEIEMRPEIGQKREDFDFTAVRGKLKINVEVTALQEKEFYNATAINALRHKRTQLPDDKPAVIFCVIPPKWESIGKDLNEWTANVANGFLLSTRRINAVVFQVERHVDMSDDRTRGGFMLISKPFEHPNPRFPCNLDSILRGGEASTGMQLMLENIIGDKQESEALALQLRTGEFYDWVDSLVP